MLGYGKKSGLLLEKYTTNGDFSLNFLYLILTLIFALCKIQCYYMCVPTGMLSLSLFRLSFRNFL